jgi:hypothetical protein
MTPDDLYFNAYNALIASRADESVQETMQRLKPYQGVYLLITRNVPMPRFSDKEKSRPQLALQYADELVSNENGWMYVDAANILIEDYIEKLADVLVHAWQRSRSQVIDELQWYLDTINDREASQ